MKCYLCEEKLTALNLGNVDALGALCRSCSEWKDSVDYGFKIDNRPRCGACTERMVAADHGFWKCEPCNQKQDERRGRSV